MFATALFLVGCTSDGYEDWVAPQGFDGEDAASVSVTYAPATVDYTAEVAEQVQLFVPTVEATEGLSPVFVAKVYGSDTDYQEISADANGMVSADELKSLVWSFFGKVREQAETFELPLEITAYTDVNGVTAKNAGGATKVTVILPELLYSEYLYLPGNEQGAGNTWDPGTAAAIHSPERDGVYTGYVYLNGGFKFTWARSWDDEYNYTHFTTYPTFMDNGDGSDTNIYCNEAGVYFLKVDVPNGVIEATKITNMNLVGDFNGWNAADDAQQMTFNKAELCYEITGATVTANGWKFTTNNTWDINLGGSISDLEANGANLSDVGTTIKLYPFRNSSEKIYATVE